MGTTGERIHICTPETCPVPGNYYVSAIDGPSQWLMAGPYTSHAEALLNVERSLAIANRHDGRAWFMGWGTVKMPDAYTEPGNLNKGGLL